MTYNIVNQLILTFSIVQYPNNFFEKEKMLDILYASNTKSIQSLKVQCIFMVVYVQILYKKT